MKTGDIICVTGDDIPAPYRGVYGIVREVDGDSLTISFIGSYKGRPEYTRVMQTDAVTKVGEVV